MCFRSVTPVKVKICPECGSANQLINTNCIKCHANFLELSSSDESAPSKAQQKTLKVLSKKQYEPEPYFDDEQENTNPFEENKTALKANFNIHNIIGESEEMVHARKLAERFAPSTANVLLIGESGTGKELFAQAIHYQSHPFGPFIVLNCAAIPRTLIESELFGYEGGAFTGAKKNGNQGKVELAHGGTLFLDEIGDMPLETQAVLLRVLENKLIMRIGGQKYQSVDFRLIAATNKDLRFLVDEGLFRLDLYYRLSVLTVNIPPLRQRGRDIIALAEFFLRKHCGEIGKLPEIDRETQLKLIEYHWPGNIRQLENAMIYALHVYDNDKILPEDLPDEITQGYITPHSLTRNNFSISNERRQAEQMKLNELKNSIASIREIEIDAIKNALLKSGNNIAQAAVLLGLSKSTLYRKVKMLGIE